MPTFVFNDETQKNSYGFRVKNSGGDFSRFDGNPVMLNSHINTPEMTLGNWQNRTLEGIQLKGDSNFDVAIPAVNQVAGQVDRGFIKGCSMGLGLSFDPASWQKGADGVMELIKWELMEVSICAVPSNSNALALYNISTGELIPEDQFKLSLQKLMVNDLQQTNTPNMEKIILTPGAISAMLAAGVTAPETPADISRGIEKLQADLSAQTSAATEAKKKYDDFVKLQAETSVDAHILAGTILKGEREEWVNFCIESPVLAAKQMAKLKSPSMLGNQVTQSEGDAAVKTVDDFEKLTDEKKLAYKAANPDAYKALFK